MVVTNEDEIKTYAAMVFLKWFTAKERNLKFTLDAGYLPVTYDAYDPEYVRKAMRENADSENLRQFAEVAMETVSNNELYTAKVFEKANDARKILENSMSNKAGDDRAKVVEKLNRGVSLKNAVSEYTSDENYKEWYIEVKKELEQCVK
jgi:multiple sugar transport system substrate-binding protein